MLCVCIVSVLQVLVQIKKRSTQETRDLSSSNRGRLLIKDDHEALMSPNPWCLMEGWSFCVCGWVLGRILCNPLFV